MYTKNNDNLFIGEWGNTLCGRVGACSIIHAVHSFHGLFSYWLLEGSALRLAARRNRFQVQDNFPVIVSTVEFAKQRSIIIIIMIFLLPTGFLSTGSIKKIN